MRRNHVTFKRTCILPLLCLLSLKSPNLAVVVDDSMRTDQYFPTNSFALGEICKLKNRLGSECKIKDDVSLFEKTDCDKSAKSLVEKLKIADNAEVEHLAAILHFVIH